jgi:uncharacterized protein
MMLDLFNHFMPKPYFDRLCAVLPNHAAVTAFPRLKTLIDLDARRRLIDEFPGLRQVLSLANPPLELIGPPPISTELARLANDSLADICRRYPESFPTFIAAVPTNDIEASIVEIERAISQLGARGIQLFTNVAGKPLSDPEFRPLFRQMANHDLPVLVHPMRGPHFSDYASEHESQDEIWFCFGWPYETTACMTRLVYSGLFDEFPDLKIVSHHMGGMLPYFPSKIKLGFKQVFFGTSEENPVAKERGLHRAPLEYFKLLYGDTALGGEVPPTRCGYEFFGSRRTVFATDAPFDAEQGRALIGNTIRGLQALDLAPEELTAVFHGNAERLLRL